MQNNIKYTSNSVKISQVWLSIIEKVQVGKFVYLDLYRFYNFVVDVISIGLSKDNDRNFNHNSYTSTLQTFFAAYSKKSLN